MEKLDFINKYGGLINTSSKPKGKRSDQDQLEMSKYLAKKVYDISVKATTANDETLKQNAGTVGENIVAEIVSGQVVSRDYDVCTLNTTALSNGLMIKPGDTIEVKTAVIQSSGRCTAYNLDGKQNKCDYIALVDMTRCKDDIRISIIPSEIFYNNGTFGRHRDKLKERFTWSGSFNESDNIVPDNTQMFLDYEIQWSESNGS